MHMIARSEIIDEERRRFVGTAATGLAVAGAYGLLPQPLRAATDGETIRPFKVNFPDKDLVDLRRRIAATKWPSRENVTDATQGVVNMTAPNPLPNRDFMRALRQAWHMPIGLPAAEWMIAIGTFLMRSESELVLKSRRVVPTLLLKHGFEFAYPAWPAAAQDLVSRMRGAA